MKIAQITSVYISVPPKTYGGTERIVHYLCRDLGPRGHQVELLKKIAKESVLPSISRRASLKDLLKSVAAKSRLSAEILLRKGRLASVVNARDQFIREAVLQQGYLASQVANFLHCHPSNVSRALQKIS